MEKEHRSLVPSTEGNVGPHSNRVITVAIGYGFVAGLIAGLSFLLMNGLQHTIWHLQNARWYIPIVIVSGGVIIIGISRWSRRLETEKHEAATPAGLDSVLTQTFEFENTHRRKKIAATALLAIVAVGFGGAIGPEAGLVALVAELSAVVGAKIGRSYQEKVLIAQSGNAAALAGVYASPPAAAAYDDDKLSPPKIVVVLSATAGLIGFFLVNKLLGGQSHGLQLPFPARISPLDGTDGLRAILPGAIGAIIALGYVAFTGFADKLIRKTTNVDLVSLLLTIVFAAIATAFPLVRFSGHHDFETLLEAAHAADYSWLLGFAVVKLLCCAICIKAGWLGGDAFPLMAAGAAAGLGSIFAVSGTDPTVAGIAGMSAALVVGLKRPLAGLLIVVFLTAGNAIAAAFVGAIIGALVVRVFKLEPAAH